MLLSKPKMIVVIILCLVLDVLTGKACATKPETKKVMLFGQDIAASPEPKRVKLSVPSEAERSVPRPVNLSGHDIARSSHQAFINLDGDQPAYKGNGAIVAPQAHQIVAPIDSAMKDGIRRHLIKKHAIEHARPMYYPKVVQNASGQGIHLLTRSNGLEAQPPPKPLQHLNPANRASALPPREPLKIRGIKRWYYTQGNLSNEHYLNLYGYEHERGDVKFDEWGRHVTGTYGP
jgi:hypothetical protein